jgi:hypothetical protein
MSALSILGGPQAWLAENGTRLLIYAATALALVGVGFGAGWQVNGWRLHADVADLKTQAAETRAKGAEQGLQDLTNAAALIKGQADSFQGLKLDLTGQFAQLRKDLKNAPPLPVDCKPDDFRVRKLHDAIDAANQAATR